MKKKVNKIMTKKSNFMFWFNMSKFYFSFKNLVNDEDDETDDLLQLRVKSSSEIKKEEDEYKKWHKDATKKVIFLFISLFKVDLNGLHFV